MLGCSFTKLAHSLHSFFFLFRPKKMQNHHKATFIHMNTSSLLFRVLALPTIHSSSCDYFSRLMWFAASTFHSTPLQTEINSINTFFQWSGQLVFFQWSCWLVPSDTISSFKTQSFNLSFNSHLGASFLTAWCVLLSLFCTCILTQMISLSLSLKPLMINPHIFGGFFVQCTILHWTIN